MLDVNPHIKVETFHEQLTSENALRICDGYDVVSAQQQQQSRFRCKSTRVRSKQPSTNAC